MSDIKTNSIETNRIILRPEKSSLSWDSTKKGKYVMCKKHIAYTTRSLLPLDSTTDIHYIYGSESFDSNDTYKWYLTVNKDCNMYVGVCDVDDGKTFLKQLSMNKKDIIRVSVNVNIMTIKHTVNKANVTKSYSLNITPSKVCPYIEGIEAFEIELKQDIYVALTATVDGLKVNNDTFKNVDNNVEYSSNTHIKPAKLSSSERLKQRILRKKETDAVNNHFDDKNIHFTVSSIDHDKLINNGRFSHTELDKHLTSEDLHFTERSILHDNISNIGHFSHPQIDKHIRRGDVHFTKDDIDHGLIKNAGKYSHYKIDKHIEDSLIHPKLNDSAVSNKNIWSAEKIQKELNSKTDSKDGVVDSLTVRKKLSASKLFLGDCLVINGVEHRFDKKIYASWLYNSDIGCIVKIPEGGEYKTLCASNSTAKKGGSSCIYKQMVSSGNPEVDLTGAVNHGEIKIRTNKEVIVDINFYINSECFVGEGKTSRWSYRLTVGKSHYYYPQYSIGYNGGGECRGYNGGGECRGCSGGGECRGCSGGIMTSIKGDTRILLSIGDGNLPTQCIDVKSIMLSIKQVN